VNSVGEYFGKAGGYDGKYSERRRRSIASRIIADGNTGTDDRELVMSLLALAPGGTAPIHKHPGIDIGYVLEGVYESQYEGEPLKRFAAGEAIYDLQDKPHLIALNGSSTEPLRLIMTFVVRKGQPTILPL
jgi:quercetin dioxygenase-like cupin family protein